MKKFYFMAGLPRSGSSALSSILNQNPKVYSGPSSPVLSIMNLIEQNFMTDELYFSFPKPAQAHQIISSIIPQFYSDIYKPFVIDKNRAWTSNIPKVENFITPDVKIIVPVRSIDQILASMIMMIRRNPYKEGTPKINFIDEQLVKNNIPISDMNRCSYISSPSGILGQSMSSIQEAFRENKQHCLHFVEYEDLVNQPDETMKKIYNFLEMDYFQHDYTSLSNQNREKDLITYGVQDLHEVRSELKSISPSPDKVLSQEILNRCKDAEFWR
jgi:sulfotransferase